MQVTQPPLPVERLFSASDEELDAMAIPAAWYAGDTIAIARALVGCVLVRRHESDSSILAARIVETEAYLPNDPASHSWRGQTHRNRAMFEAGGCLYVYRIYGVHRCVNIVTGLAGEGAAVLLRAAEPLAGITHMQARRGRSARQEGLLSGPANLACAFGFDLDDNNRPCTRDGVWIVPHLQQICQVAVSPRIGISRNQEALLRFFDPDSAAVSAHRRAVEIHQLCTGFSTFFPHAAAAFGSGASDAVNLNCPTLMQTP